ncbi:MAG: flavodoxin domain-containing protein [Anaerolineaceae bacterium]|nr:flavodoxin domain-containing protein [Anaerolineaceae bacterium]
MNDCLVVYTSKSGFTERYAQWIAEELGCEMVELSKLTPPRLFSAKTLIYGGPIHAGWVTGLKKFLRRKERHDGQNIFVFGVGLTPGDAAAEIKRYQTANLKDREKNVPWFYFKGGLDVEKLKGFDRLMMSLVARHSKKEKEKLPESEEGGAKVLMVQDYCDKEAIAPLVAAVRALE